MIFESYHAHLNYNDSTFGEAQTITEKVEKFFGVSVGHFHLKPVGPHPVWSCQLSVSNQQFAEVIPWLMQNHGKVDVFVHGKTGNDLADQTDHVMWIGKSYDLNLENFK